MSRTKWTRQRVIEAIRARHRSGQPVTTTWKEDTALYSAAKREFDGWRKALLAAGLVRDWRTWNRQRVIEAIRSRQRRGLSVTRVWKEDAPLHAIAKRYFGSWPNAVQAAGLEPKRRTYWTRTRVIRAIRDYSQAGRSMTDVWNQDKALAAAAYRHLGGRVGAMTAAGLRPKPRRKWTRQRVLEELWARDQQARNSHGGRDQALGVAARKYFGRLRDARQAAGLEPSRRGWSRQRVIEAIQNRYVRRRAIGAGGQQDRPLVLAARRHFGSWQAALAAAGILREDGR